MRAIHQFDNGVKVYDDQLLPVQRERYKKKNVHEAEEEDIFIELMQNLPANGCYVNVGSAIGYYVLFAGRLRPDLTIHAVEPLEEHQTAFRENVTLNGFRKDDFTLHTVGVSSSNGQASFLSHKYGSRIIIKKGIGGFFRSLLGLNPKNVPHGIDGETVTIQTVTLDSFLPQIGNSVDFLQMDVQCLEVDVLQGASEAMKTGRIQTFLIGTHRASLHRKCLKILRQYEYRILVDRFETQEQPDGILVAKRS